ELQRGWAGLIHAAYYRPVPPLCSTRPGRVLISNLVASRTNYSHRGHPQLTAREQPGCSDTLANLRLQCVRIRRLDQSHRRRALPEKPRSPAAGSGRVGTFGVGQTKPIVIATGFQTAGDGDGPECTSV